jgi:hypothetical protein
MSFGVGLRDFEETRKKPTACTESHAVVGPRFERVTENDIAFLVEGITVSKFPTSRLSLSVINCELRHSSLGHFSIPGEW